MRLKTKITTLLIASIAGLAIASPVRDDNAARQLVHTEEDVLVNYWVWPTQEQSKRQYQNPPSVWTPEIGIWYWEISDNGYKDMGTGNYLIDWGENFVTTKYHSGYSAATFLALEPGHYILICKVDGRARFRTGYYTEVEDGFKFLSCSTWTPQETAGKYERVFTVPEGAALTLFLLTSSGNMQLPALTVTDVEIYRLD